MINLQLKGKLRQSLSLSLSLLSFLSLSLFSTNFTFSDFFHTPVLCISVLEMRQNLKIHADFVVPRRVDSRPSGFKGSDFHVIKLLQL